MTELFMKLSNSHSLIFLIFLILNIIDWLTGWAKARRLKKESSSVGAMGAVKKIASWLIIFISFALSYAFSELGQIVGIDMSAAIFLGWFVLISLIVNEIRSICENLVECNIKVPTILITGLDVFDDKIEEVMKDEKDH